MKKMKFGLSFAQSLNLLHLLALLLPSIAVACSASDYVIVAGDPLDAASDPPIVAFRASA